MSVQKNSSSCIDLSLLGKRADKRDKKLPILSVKQTFGTPIEGTPTPSQQRLKAIERINPTVSYRKSLGLPTGQPSLSTPASSTYPSAPEPR